jgi:hypothetical protein
VLPAHLAVDRAWRSALAAVSETYFDGRMAAIAKLGAVSLDSSDPAGLSAFYRQLLDLEVHFESEGIVALKGAGILVTMQKVDDYSPPDWPSGSAGKQIHLELSVDDLDEAETKALAIGARKADTQPNPEVWRVLLDPAGHPFCITTLIPDL